MKLDPEQAVLFQRVVRAVSLKLGRPVSPLFILTRLCAQYLAAEDDISVDQVLKEAAEQVAAEVQSGDREVARARRDLESEEVFEARPIGVEDRTPTESSSQGRFVPESPEERSGCPAVSSTTTEASAGLRGGQYPAPAAKDDPMVCEEQAPPWAVASAQELVCPSDENLHLVVGTRVPYWRGTDLEQRLRFNPDARECTPAQRRALFRRDGYRCSTPGCPNHLWLHVHHIVFHYLGGPTLPPNLVCLCSRCHRNVHEGRLVVKGSAPGELRFLDRSGKPLVRPVEVPVPPGLVDQIAAGAVLTSSLHQVRSGTG